MHICSVCNESCTCSGDVGTPVGVEPASCEHCLGLAVTASGPTGPEDEGHCEHGIGLEAHCHECVIESEDIEEALAE